jgi:hypothetical protein
VVGAAASARAALRTVRAAAVRVFVHRLPFVVDEAPVARPVVSGFSPPGTRLRLDVAREHLSRAMSDYEDAVYLTAIQHCQAPSPRDLERKSAHLEQAYAKYRELAGSLLSQRVGQS